MDLEPVPSAVLDHNYSDTIGEILFLDDFFRSPENGLDSSWQNRKFLKAFFGTAAIRLGLTVREISPQSSGGTLVLSDVMQQLGLSESREGWAQATIADLATTDLTDTLNIKPTTLVIGWGLPPSILRHIDIQSAAFLDFELHWVRFASNLNLAVRTNRPEIAKNLEPLRVNEERFWSAAAALRAHFARRGAPSFLHHDARIGVFAGQMEVDLSLVQGGLLTQPLEYIDRIRAWAQEVDLLAICPHPAMVDQTQMRELSLAIPNAIMTGANTYTLISAENIAFLSAMSSGILKEAKYIGCTDSRQLIIDDRNNKLHLSSYCSEWMPVHLEIASAPTLRAIMQSGSNNARERLDTLPLKDTKLFPDDTIDKIFGYRWGLDLSVQGLVTLPTIKPEEALGLAKGQSGSACISVGHEWHPSEDWGTWTASSRAHLTVALDASAKTWKCDLELVLKGRLCGPDQSRCPQIRVSVNDRELDVFVSNYPEIEFRFYLDKKTSQLNLIVIAIDVVGALRACELGGHPDDKREFGLGVTEVILRPRFLDEADDRAASDDLQSVQSPVSPGFRSKPLVAL